MPVPTNFVGYTESAIRAAIQADQIDSVPKIAIIKWLQHLTDTVQSTKPDDPFPLANDVLRDAITAMRYGTRLLIGKQDEEKQVKLAASATKPTAKAVAAATVSSFLD